MTNIMYTADLLSDLNMGPTQYRPATYSDVTSLPGYSAGGGWTGATITVSVNAGVTISNNQNPRFSVDGANNLRMG